MYLYGRYEEHFRKKIRENELAVNAVTEVLGKWRPHEEFCDCQGDWNSWCDNPENYPGTCIGARHLNPEEMEDAYE